MGFQIDLPRSPKTTNGTTNETFSNALLQDAKTRGTFIVLLSTNDKTLTAIAKKFNMSLTDFKNMTGLTKDTLAKHQVIKNVPVAKIKSGKGIASLAKENGMTLEQFCALNNITKDYKPQKDEYFYVFPKQKNKPEKNINKVNAQPSQKESEPPKDSNKPVEMKTHNAKEIADGLENKADSLRGAVGKKEFDNIFNQINKDNVVDVIKTFEKDNNKSLINMISDEWSSTPEARKAAMTRIFDLVYAQKGESPGETRKRFLNELDSQFDKWSRVSTKKLDRMINNAIEYAPIYDKKGVEIAYAGERKVAIKDARPPLPKDKDGNITAEVVKFLPENDDGPLAGKTIMVNAGHGWAKSGKFCPGSEAKDPRGKNEYEWARNRNFAEKLIQKLTSQGATVVFTAGDASPACDAKKNHSSDLLISLHCNWVKDKNKNGLEIFYPEGSPEGIKFAQVADKHLDEFVDNRCVIKSDIQTKHKRNGLLREDMDKTPSILIEMGFQSNKTDLRNIDNDEFQDKSMAKVADAVKEYLKGA